MDCAKSIDELYDEVKDYDLVVTNDAALATALNGRVGKPIIGPFAVTPKMIAGMLGRDVTESMPMRDLEAITAVARETNLDFRYVHSEIENIKEIRRYTRSVENYMYTDDAKAVWASYRKIPTQMKVMDAFNPDVHSFFENFGSVAVIGTDLFNDLDKHFIPIDSVDIPLFKKGDYGIDRIYEIGNDRQIAENAVGLIDPENPLDYAIVLKADSPLTDAVRSALYRRDIPFVNELNVKDLTQIRDYLQFLTLSLSFDTIRVRNLRELLLSFNIKMSDRKDNVLVYKFFGDMDEDFRENPDRERGKSEIRLHKILGIMKDIRSQTFDGFLSDSKNEDPDDGRVKIPGVSQINMLLEDMNLKGVRITPKKLANLIYAVNNVSDLRHNEQIPDSERKGVLITDCANSVYIDRPVVMFLGMEQDWNVPVIGKPYKDAEAETEKNALRLKLLIQQGSERIYCVNTVKNGKKARPSLTFDTIFGTTVDTFDRMCGELVHGRWMTEEPPTEFERGVDDVDPNREFRAPFSKTTYNAYLECPRKFMFQVLISGQDEKSTEFGNLIHEFAELYACYPDLVRERGIDEFVDMVSDKYTGLSSAQMASLDRDKVRLAMVNITRFLDKHGISGLDPDVHNSRREHPNRFIEKLGLEMCSSSCETEDDPKGIPIHGVYDLYHEGTIVDYKTGRTRKYPEIRRKMDTGSKEKFLDMQPMFYLTLARGRADCKDSFNLFYAMDNDVESLDPSFDIDRNVRTVRVIRKDPVDAFLNSEHLRSWMSRSLSADYREHADEIMDAFAEFRVDSIEDWRTDEALINRVYGIAFPGKRGKTDSARTAVKRIVDHYVNGMIETDECLEIPEQTMNDFVEGVRERHAEAMEQARTRMPCRPRGACRDCEYFYACMEDLVDFDEGEE